MKADVDRDLIFGLLALQNGMVTRDRLVAAFGAWTADGDKLLADLLAEQRALRPEHRALLDALPAAHLKLHGGDAGKSLASLAVNRSARESLARAGGADVEATLDRVGSGSTEHDVDAERTISYAVGATTARGQRFRILRPYAQGGLGAVFVALDTELNRDVALKQILDDRADDPVSRQRFLVEAEVTGGLEHPGIVPVYSLGTYDGGRPYYAMRFIKGDSLRQTIDRSYADADTSPNASGLQSLALRKLLRRFLDVCNAIDYAHSRGVLHRDIKPSNIIVGKHGETLVVDWGLAKPLGRTEPGSASDERTLMPASATGSAETLPGSALGTPSYMSPQQAAGQLDRVGPRSDVYSLGATLYYLLTGKPPVQDEDIGAALCAVQNGDFPPPRRLGPSLEVKNEALAAAQRETARERDQKSKEATKAEAEEQKARKSASEAKAMLEFFRDQVLAAPRPEGQAGGLGNDVTLRAALDAAEPDIAAGFADQPAVEAAIRYTLAESYRHLGETAKAARQHEQERDLRADALGPNHLDTIDSMNALGLAFQGAGRVADAIPLHREALERFQTKPGPDHPDTLATMNNLALAYRDAGRPGESLPLLEKALERRRAKLGPEHIDTLAAMNHLGGAYLDAGRWSDAEVLLSDCLGRRKKAHSDDARVFHTMSQFGAAVAGQAKHAEAEPLLIEGYKALKAREAKIPAPAKKLLTRAAARIGPFYEAWGKKDKAEEWRKKLAVKEKP